MFAPLSRLARRMRMRVTEEILHIVEIEDGYINIHNYIYTNGKSRLTSLKIVWGSLRLAPMIRVVIEKVRILGIRGMNVDSSGHISPAQWSSSVQLVVICQSVFT